MGELILVVAQTTVTALGLAVACATGEAIAGFADDVRQTPEDLAAVASPPRHDVVEDDRLAVLVLKRYDGRLDVGPLDVQDDRGSVGDA